MCRSKPSEDTSVTDTINWKAELRKIEREYDTHGASGRRVSANGMAAPPLSPAELANGAMLRIGLSLAVAVGIIFWPYANDCGSGLFWFLGAAVVVVIGGIWSVWWTWRNRMARSHALSLVIVLWGLAVAAAQVLPRTGHMTLSASPTRVHWFCPGYSPKEIVDEIMGSR
jgi:hypothetical protein